jgi:hypothetical protein
MGEGCAPKKFYARAFTQRIDAHEWEMPPQNLRYKRRKSHSASGRRRISAGARLGFEERSGFGAAQLGVEADTARRRPAGRAGSSTHKEAGGMPPAILIARCLRRRALSPDPHLLAGGMPRRLRHEGPGRAGEATNVRRTERQAICYTL